ncbi:MAG: hypothetical protein KDI63_03785, partial [Gammaproteobacteria bacterium]|nr:hypothetical protein [Gammaproteobacteria bacterium]
MKRMPIGILLLMVVISTASFAKTRNDDAAIPGKDVVLVVNADIVTMDPGKPSAEAMAVSGGRILAVGTESEVRKTIGDYTKFYNLEGRTIVPGFIETHDHLYMSSSQYVVTDVTPFTTPTLAAALDKIRHTQPNEEGWVVGFGADQQLYEEKRGPSR